MSEEYAPCAVDAECMSVDKEDTTTDNPAVSAVRRNVYSSSDVCLGIISLVKLNVAICSLGGGGWEGAAIVCGTHRVCFDTILSSQYVIW